MPDAQQLQDRREYEVYTTLGASISVGEIWQLKSGEAAVYAPASAGASGANVKFLTRGQFVVTKTSGVVILDGGAVYWDHSAGSATFRKVNDRDFFLGVAVGDAASDDTTLTVNLNVQPQYLLDISRDPWVDAVVGTQALGGLLPARRRGGAHNIVLSATNEAQKVDMLSRDGFATGANAIVEFALNVISDGAGTVVDVSVGIANATHATDADSITDSIFCHLDANNTNINFESDDGTTEVAATDSTLDYTEGTRFEVWMDMRDPTSVKIYVNGVRVLSATSFNVNASVATWKLLVHVEKTASTDTYELDVDWLKARIAEQ